MAERKEQYQEGNEQRRSELLRIMRITETLLEQCSPSSSTETRPPSGAGSTDIHSENTPMCFQQIPSTPAGGSQNIMNDFRRLFAPYGRTRPNNLSSRVQEHSRRRLASGGGGKSSGRKWWGKGRTKFKATWTHDFFCLNSRKHEYIPSPKQRLEHIDAGLGRRKITFDGDGDANHVSTKLEEMFPKLSECGGFEILRSQGAKEKLRLVNPPKSGYSVSFLRDLSGLGGAVAYIRPIQLDISLSKTEEMDPGSQVNMEIL